MFYCSHCGAQVNDGANYCPRCGNHLSQSFNQNSPQNGIGYGLPFQADSQLSVSDALYWALMNYGDTILDNTKELWRGIGDIVDTNDPSVEILRRSCSDTFLAAMRSLKPHASSDEARLAVDHGAEQLMRVGVSEELSRETSTIFVNVLLKYFDSKILTYDGQTNTKPDNDVINDHTNSFKTGIRNLYSAKIKKKPEGAKGDSSHINEHLSRVIIGVVSALLCIFVGFGALIALRGANEEAHGAFGTETTSSTNDVNNEIPVREELSEYSWVELKNISRSISEAESDRAGLDIAKRYNLVGADGRLEGSVKSVTLTDGSEAYVRIIGFRQDDLASGGKAGISFEFADVPTRRQMNPSASNKGGWEHCAARVWLNSGFIELLPEDLGNALEPVIKKTNNTGPAAYENDVSGITTTIDRCWLLSMTEVYGSFSAYKYAPWSPATYDAEGVQYQLYADQGVSAEEFGYCIKAGAADNCWLRSPFAGGVERFRTIDSGGSWENKVVASTVYGISPGFCI